MYNWLWSLCVRMNSRIRLTSAKVGVWVEVEAELGNYKLFFICRRTLFMTPTVAFETSFVTFPYEMLKQRQKQGFKETSWG